MTASRSSSARWSMTPAATSRSCSAKCIRQGALDQELSAEDKERMLNFLTAYGDLKPDGKFNGTERSGYKVLPGAGPQDGVPRDPLPMHALLDADLWQGCLPKTSSTGRPPCSSPSAAWTRFPRAFEKKLGTASATTRRSCASARLPPACRSPIKDRISSRVETLDADYCICAMPLTMLKNRRRRLLTRSRSRHPACQL